jgi:hypothetical protein
MAKRNKKGEIPPAPSEEEKAPEDEEGSWTKAEMEKMLKDSLREMYVGLCERMDHMQAENLKICTYARMSNKLLSNRHRRLKV